jgi:hypothetical protein
MIRAALAFGVFAASVDAFAPTLPSSMRTRYSPVAVSMATRAETMQPFEERRALKVGKNRDPRNQSCTAPAPDLDRRPAPGPWLIRVHPLCLRHFRLQAPRCPRMSVVENLDPETGGRSRGSCLDPPNQPSRPGTDPTSAQASIPSPLNPAQMDLCSARAPLTGLLPMRRLCRISHGVACPRRWLYPGSSCAAACAHPFHPAGHLRPEKFRRDQRGRCRRRRKRRRCGPE